MPAQKKNSCLNSSSWTMESPHDTFNRVFSSIDPDQFEACFVQWASTLAQLNPKEVIAIDGKVIRGAKANRLKSPFHMVFHDSSATQGLSCFTGFTLVGPLIFEPIM
jgi:hypothetical protein